MCFVTNELGQKINLPWLLLDYVLASYSTFTYFFEIGCLAIVILPYSKTFGFKKIPPSKSWSTSFLHSGSNA